VLILIWEEEVEDDVQGDDFNFCRLSFGWVLLEVPWVLLEVPWVLLEVPLDSQVQLEGWGRREVRTTWTSR